MSEETYIDVIDIDRERKVTLCIEKDNTLILLGILNHGSKLRFQIKDLKKLKNWCESALKELQK